MSILPVSDPSLTSVGGQSVHAGEVIGKSFLLILFCLFLLDWFLMSNALVQSLLLLLPGTWSSLLQMKEMRSRQNKHLPRPLSLAEEKEKDLPLLRTIPCGLVFQVSS